MWKALEEKIHPFRHHLLTISFVGGFIIDNFTLVRVDLLIDDILISSYVVISMLGMIFMYLGASDKYSPRFKEIADKTGVPVNTLLSRKRYAVLFLRDKLKDLYKDLLDVN